MIDFTSRIARVKDEMERSGVDCLLVSVGADLPYLTGYEAMPLERLTMLVMPMDGTASLVVPRLEAPRVPPGPFEVREWGETDDPITLVAAAAARPVVAAIGDQTWAVFLLRLLARMTETTFVSASTLMTELRIRKEPAETAALGAAGAAVDRVAVRIPRELRFEGRSEREIARDVAAMTLEEGHQTVSFSIVASGPNGASPHHEPGERICGQGDAVVVDFGGRMAGYCSDTTRTFVVGQPDPDLVRVHSIVEEAQLVGREAAVAGVKAEQVDRAAREVIEHAGYGDYFVHRVGHGIGLETHEPPYLVAGNDQILQEGMAFSIEPGIYLPGRFGVRIEDICVIDSSGNALCLNNSPRELVVVE